MMSYSLNDAHVQHVNDLSCIYICIYINNYFGPYQTDPGPVSDWIVNEKKKKVGHGCARSHVHGRIACPCISDLGALAQSAHPYFLD